MSKVTGMLFSVILAAVLFVAGCVPAGSSSNQTDVREGVSMGNRAPDFQVLSMDGKPVQLSDYRGKPVLLNFWATWCPPCRSEAPFLDQVNAAYAPKGLVMLAVDIGENTTIINNFMTSLNLSMPVFRDADSSVAKAYGIAGIPTTFLLDKDGIIRFKLVGAFRDRASVETALKTIMP